VLIVNQEMVIRLGAVTGVGHARMIFERFGRFWGAFSVGDLFLLNFLTIVTEFIGVSLALGYLGVSKYLAVPIAAAALVAITSTGSFRSWERFMYVFVVANFLVIPLLILAHPNVGDALDHTFVPSIHGGANSTAVLLIISIIGTTVAPWQLFFQESNIVDKKISPRWLNYERVDTILGSFIVVIGASALVAICAAGLAGHGGTNAFTSALGVAHALNARVGHGAGALFSLILLNASIIGATCVTLASSYAINDLSASVKGLDVPFREARGFYLGFAGLLFLLALLAGYSLGLEFLPKLEEGNLWIRATLPRMRVDRLMNFAWKYLVPLSIINILIAGVWFEIVIRPGHLTFSNWVWGFAVTAVLVVLSVYLVFLVNRKASARVALGSEWPSLGQVRTGATIGQAAR